MTPLIKGISMRSSFILFLSIGLLPFTVANAADFSGTWQYEQGKEYFGQLKVVPPPPNKILQISNGKLVVSEKCVVPLGLKKYIYSDVFQSLLKEDVEEPALDKYVRTSFSFPLLKTASYFQVDKQPTDCNKPMRDFFIAGDKLLVPFAGSAFYSFTRSDGNIGKQSGSSVQLYGHKVSQLPFSMNGYSNACLATLPQVKGIPQANDKCSPVYVPYVASSVKADPLTLLIGTHDYKQASAGDADDYNNPFAQKLHPVFLVLPPLKDVVLVRVDDMEPGVGEKRETMSGAFLAIKNGKVIDQLNQGCLITTDYICRDEDGKAQYQLTDTGKFKKLN